MAIGPVDAIIWDEANVAHIAQHGLTIDEVEEVLRDRNASRGTSKTSGLPIAFGWTSTDRFIAVIWRQIHDDPRIVRPVTAFDAPPPTKRKR